ncbi:streptophobe family protein [Streptomyces sp. S07_1.15]|uniref:streptophobe family protein n=1 Tax=Streptomyces sp. S07_1.15 TaxID=2873925 RepID=UPI001D143B59|nr:streptophobe family protein [Streptomyces sp. S07_1.15]MCC3654891.1 streptophobe family protein [Streptomyces sp. S07_1.15]
MRAEGNRGIRPADALLTAVAAVGWAFVAMTGTAALALHLLEADAVGSLGPMTAAAVVLAVNGRVVPAGDVGVFGLEGGRAAASVDITPLGVALVGALVLAAVFLRSLRGAGGVIGAGELAVRAGAVVALFLAVVGGLSWAGHDTVTFDGAELGDLAGDLPDSALPDSGLPEGIAELLPEGLGDLGGGLAARLADLVRAEASVGFRVDTGPSLLGGALWVAGVLVIALLASRRTPLPPGWEVLHRVVRPAVSALCAALLLAVGAGLAAAVWAAAGDEHPARIAGTALLVGPNGAWTGMLLGLFVPWTGWASGALVRLLPAPLDRLLTASEETITVGRLAELDGRAWLLVPAAVLALLCAGALTAVRTPRDATGTSGAGTGAPAAAGARGAGASAGGRPAAPGPSGSAAARPGPGGGRTAGTAAFAVRCAVPLAVATGLGLPLLTWLTGVSANASLSVFGFDAFGAGLELGGNAGLALLLGAVWGAAAGAAGALLAGAAGVAGRRASAPGTAPHPRSGGAYAYGAYDRGRAGTGPGTAPSGTGPDTDREPPPPPPYPPAAH